MTLEELQSLAQIQKDELKKLSPFNDVPGFTTYKTGDSILVIYNPEDKRFLTSMSEEDILKWQRQSAE